jgi:hypothetical protein
VIKVSLPGASVLSSSCFLGVSAGRSLKPAADSKSELELVVAQPTVNANRAMTAIVLNEVRIRFIFVPG